MPTSSTLQKWFSLVWFYGAYHHFQQYFSYIVAVSFIGGGNHRPVASPDFPKTVGLSVRTDRNASRTDDFKIYIGPNVR
jgi:hypothetical protein